MEHLKNMLLRVNGVPIHKVQLRTRRNVQNDRVIEVVINDPLVGHFGLTGEFNIQVQKPSGKSPLLWQQISLEELIALLKPDLGPENVGINNSDVVHLRAFNYDYADQFRDKDEERLPTGEEWERAIRKTAKALFRRGIPHFVLSPYSPELRRGMPTPIQVIVTDPSAAVSCVRENNFELDVGHCAQVVEPDSSLKVRFLKGSTI